MYLGSLGIAVGAALIVGTWLTWLVPVVLFLLQNFVIIPFEQRSMQRGDEERVPRSLHAAQVAHGLPPQPMSDLRGRARRPSSKLARTRRPILRAGRSWRQGRHGAVAGRRRR